jgi:hypothetical protein
VEVGVSVGVGVAVGVDVGVDVGVAVGVDVEVGAAVGVVVPFCVAVGSARANGPTPAARTAPPTTTRAMISMPGVSIPGSEKDK